MASTVLHPPVEPMLARLERSIPVGDYLYEPKWDGFRCLAFVDADGVDLRSRNHRPFGRYFPEVVAGLEALGRDRMVLDGELVAARDGVSDFSALLARLHPAASRVALLAESTPATFVVFDVLACDGDDLTELPFARRRAVLESVVGPAGAPAVVVTPITADPVEAADWLDRSPRSGVDGVVAKHRDLTYQAGRRAMVKVKRERTVDCVVAGLRVTLDNPDAVASLLLGLYDDAGELRHVGVASSFPRKQRLELLDVLEPLAVPLAAHPWARGFALEGGPTGRLPGSAGRWTPEMSHDWLPLAPVQVCEVGYDQRDGLRFRHPARFKRWRPDRDPRSCTTDQLQA